MSHPRHLCGSLAHPAELGSAHMASSVAELAYQTAVAQLDRQQEELTQLRQRTGMLMAAGSLVASFLGAETLGREGTSPYTALAILTFFASTGCCVYLLIPKYGLGFAMSGSQLHQQFHQHGRRLEPVYVELAEYLQEAWNTNLQTLDRMNQYFAAASGLLIAEMVLWILALRGRIPVEL